MNSISSKHLFKFIMKAKILEFQFSLLLSVCIFGQREEQWKSETTLTYLESPIIDMLWCGSSTVLTDDYEHIE